jgi:hypothetical protein
MNQENLPLKNGSVQDSTKTFELELESAKVFSLALLTSTHNIISQNVVHYNK